MRYAIKCVAGFATQNARNQAAADIDAQFAGATVDFTHDRLRNTQGTNDTLPWGLTVLRRLPSDADAEAVRAKVAPIFASFPDGSTIHVHRCYIDEDPPQRCVVLRAWERVDGATVRTL